MNENVDYDLLFRIPTLNKYEYHDLNTIILHFNFTCLEIFIKDCTTDNIEISTEFSSLYDWWKQYLQNNDKKSLYEESNDRLLQLLKIKDDMFVMRKYDEFINKRFENFDK